MSLSESKEDLTKCSICHSLMTDPKALPCLHTYCLLCIHKWANKDQGDGTVICPICREKTKLPPGGVIELKSNFFVTSLKDRKLAKQKLKGKKIICTSCGKEGEDAVSHCVNCKDYLCLKCTEAHAMMRVLKHHRIIAVDEVNVADHESKKQTTCGIHRGKKLCIYCETCGEVICEVCTVVKHKKPEHRYTELNRAYRMQKKELQILGESCEKIAHQVESAMEDAKSAIERLDEAAETTSKSVDVAKEQALSDFRNQLDKSSLKAKAEIRKWKADTARTLSENEDTLECQKARLDNAIAMVSQIIKIGSPFDITSAYPVLSETLEQLSKLQPTTLPSRISNVEFHANNDKIEVTSLGTLVAGSRGYTHELKIQDEMMGDAKGITVAPSGDIVVAEFRPGRPVNVFNDKGLFRLSLTNTNKKDCPWDVVVSQEGFYYVSTCGQFVIVYDSDGRLCLRIKPNPPFNPFLSSQTPDLRGLAINSKGHILIGDVKHNFISVHQPRGEQISGFSISIPPYFIAISNNDKVIVSASSRAGFQILSSVGHRLRSFDTMESAILNWVTGICCSSGGSIYVGNRKGMRGIHEFTEDGNYVACITEHVTNPWGISLTTNEDQLVVAEETSIKFVHLK